MFYDIHIKATIESSLSKTDLENQLVVALYDTDSQSSKFDGAGDNLQVIDYKLTEAEEVGSVS